MIRHTPTYGNPYTPDNLPSFIPPPAGSPAPPSAPAFTEVNYRRLVSDVRSTPLVQHRITQNDYFFSFYPKDIRIRPFLKKMTPTPDNGRSEVTGFSRASQRRLSFVARNSGEILISQFCMTYHKIRPDGSASKKHLNHFLTTLRQRFPELRYLWIMEFQKRGVVHFHLFSNLRPSTALRLRLARLWNKITGEGEEHRRFHASPTNFIKWVMGSGNYVTKYLQKMEQKGVPEDYTNCGRFWGSSRGLLPVPYQFSMEEILQYLPYDQDPVHSAKFIRRTILKCYESALRRVKKKRVNLRRSKKTVLVPFGLQLFYQILQYLNGHFLLLFGAPYDCRY